MHGSCHIRCWRGRVALAFVLLLICTMLPLGIAHANESVEMGEEGVTSRKVGLSPSDGEEGVTDKTQGLSLKRGNDTLGAVEEVTDASGTWKYRPTDEGALLVEYLKKGTDEGYDAGGGVVVPQTVDNYSVIALSVDVFKDDDKLKQISLPDGLTIIGAGAFMGSGLTTITVPATVTSIGVECFKGCTSLNTASMASCEVLASVSQSCFEDCTGLTSVTISSSVNTIGEKAFSGCVALKSVSFGAATLVDHHLTTIKANAFADCKQLEAVSIPRNVETIESNAFAGCASLETLEFVEGSVLDTIEDTAFLNCTSLTEVFLPDQLTKLGEKAFAGCGNLKTVAFESELNSKEGKNAFEGCNSVNLIIVPRSISRDWHHMGINTKAKIVIMRMTYTKGPTGPKGTASIDEIRLINEGYITSVTVPVSVGPYDITSIGPHVTMYDTYSISELHFATGSKIADIAEGAFARTGGTYSNVSSFEIVDIPPSVGSAEGTGLGESAFIACPSLKTVNFLTDTVTHTTALTTIPESCFESCTSLEAIEVPEGVTTIEKRAFYNCSGVTKITLPKTLDTIGAYAYHCDDKYDLGLRDITFPDTNKTVDIDNTHEEFFSQWPLDIDEDEGATIHLTFGSFFDSYIEDHESTADWWPTVRASRSYTPVSLALLEDPDDKQFSVNVPQDQMGKNGMPTVEYANGVVYPDYQISRWLRELTKFTHYNISPAEGYDCKSVGQQKCEITGSYPWFKDSCTLTYQIEPADVQGVVQMVGTVEPVLWDGDYWCPTPKFVAKFGWNTVELTEGEDYTLSYENNNHAGTAQIILSGGHDGSGNYGGSTTFDFIINKASLSKAEVVIPDQWYTGEAVEPKPTSATMPTRDPAERAMIYYKDQYPNTDDDYDLSYENNVNVGTAKATLLPCEDSSLDGSKEVTFNIKQVNMADVEVDQIKDQTYTGQPVKPAITATIDGAELKSGVAYTATYKNNVNAGTATVTLTGNGTGVVGTKTVYFAIKRKGVTVTPSRASKVYGESDPEFGATVDGVVDGFAIVYGFERDKGENVGTYTVRAKGDKVQGNYEVTFGKTSLTISTAPIDRVQVAPIEDCVYDGQPYYPEPTLTYNGVALTKDKDYALSYGANTSPGQWQVHIAGKGNFSSSRDETFLIVKYDISKNYCNVVVPIQQYAGGEEVRPVPLYVEVHDRSGNKMRMTASTDYEVTGYRKNVEIGTGHLTIEGRGNYVGSCDGHFGIVNSNDLGLGVVADIPDQTYAAEPIEPLVNVYLEGIELLPLRDVDYTAEFRDNVNVGTAAVTLTGINGMKGVLQTTFRIVPKAATVTARDATKTYGDADPELSADVEGIIDGDGFSPTYELVRAPGEDVGTYAISATGEELQGNYRLAYAGATLTVGPAQIASADVAPVADQVHTGSPIEPKPDVTFKGQALEEGRDYSLSYADNVDMGTAHMTIKGMGNFTGEQALSFQIVGAEYSLKTGPEDSYVIGSDIPLEFSFTRADDDALTFDRFVGAQVDGKELAEGEYATRRGSLVVSLASSYLDGLSEGKHTLTVTFDDGSATADFTVTRAADSGSGEKKADSGSDEKKADSSGDTTASDAAGSNTARDVSQGVSKQTTTVTGSVTQATRPTLATTGDATDRAALAALLCALAGLAILCRSRYL